jgi:hypothetical protein
VRAGTSENRKNTEFATILEMGLREAYPGRAIAVLAYGALEDTHTEHPPAQIATNYLFYTAIYGFLYTRDLGHSK